MKLFTQATVAIAGLSLATMAMAADPLANTTWQTYEDGSPKATVKITESGGTLTGKVIAGNTDKAKAYVGRTVITGLKADGNGSYSGGKITDPVSGKTYNMKADLSGNTLKLRGYLGPFYRTQTWKKK